MMKKRIVKWAVSLAYGLSYSLVVLLAVAIIGYFFKYDFGKLGTEVPGFQLATVSAVIGGLLLASAGIALYAETQFTLRRVAVCYLLATVAFVVLGLTIGVAD